MKKAEGSGATHQLPSACFLDRLDRVTLTGHLQNCAAPLWQECRGNLDSGGLWCKSESSLKLRTRLALPEAGRDGVGHPMAWGESLQKIRRGT
jgi:hypothetical protein